MARRLRKPHYEPIHFLELQMTGSALEDEMLGRYLSNPDNLEQIRSIAERMFLKLAELPAGEYQCPEGQNHVHCRCRLEVISRMEETADRAMARRASQAHRAHPASH